MANVETTDLANEDLNSIVIKAMISVGLAVNLGFAGALSPLLYALLVATAFGLAGWLAIEHAPTWLLGLSVLARVSDFKTSGAKSVIADFSHVAEIAESAVNAAELLNFDPLESSQEFWSPSDLLKITDHEEIFNFVLQYNKEAPEIASRNLRFVIKDWGVKPETRIIWLDAIKKIEFHNDGQAMANIFFGGELPMVAYTNAHGKPVSCWEDSVKLPSQMPIR